MKTKDDIRFSRGFLDALLSEAEGECLRLVEPLVNVCESPIEIQFLAAFRMFAQMMGYDTSIEVDNLGIADRAPRQSFDIFAQVRIEKWRVDFLIFYADRSAIVECDGRDYHHSTREQIERDRERDAKLFERGHKVIRFPGRELDTSPFHCAADVLMWLLTGKYAAR